MPLSEVSSAVTSYELFSSTFERNKVKLCFRMNLYDGRTVLVKVSKQPPVEALHKPVPGHRSWQPVPPLKREIKVSMIVSELSRLSASRWQQQQQLILTAQFS